MPDQWKGGTPFSRGGNENGDQQQLKATPRFGRGDTLSGGGMRTVERATILCETVSSPADKPTIIVDARGIGCGACVDEEIHPLPLGSHVPLHTALSFLRINKRA